MDKNNATGLLLISLLLLAYFLVFSPEEQQLPQPEVTPQEQATTTQGQEEKDIEQLQPQAPEITEPDSVLAEKFGFFGRAMRGQAQEVVLENDVMTVVFDVKGAYPKQVTLKNYLTYGEQPVVLISEDRTRISETLQTAGGEIDLNTLYYQVQQSAGQVQFSIADGQGRSLTRTYSLGELDYTLGYDLDLNGLGSEVPAQNLNYYWYNEMLLVEKDMPQSRIRSTINYYTLEGSFENLSETSEEEESDMVEVPVQWVAMKQKFFNTALVTDTRFEQVEVATDVPKESTTLVKKAEMQLNIPLEGITSGEANLRYYFGPNDYNICEAVAPGFEDNVYLGWSIFSTINLYLIIPLFEFLEDYIANYGIIILILVFIVKSFLFPLTYRSYFSMAKMRVLQPELTELREKYPDDMQKQQQEQMKLYSKVGVNPISGCIPILAQMPVFLAMFNFFPNAIQLRQEDFLWAEDLSTYDSILELPFTIPFYGDHVSLFCLLMTASQIVYTFYNNQMNPQAAGMQGPVNMKVISYITPVMFLFFLNSFSAGLTYYYFISNLITIGQQLIIRRLINEDKIKNILDENRKRNKNKKSRLQQQLEAMQQKEAQRKKNKRK